MLLLLSCNSEVNIKEAFKYYLAGPGKVGPIADLVENWALHFLGPSLHFFWQIGPLEIVGVANWAPGNQAMASWATVS